MIKEIKNLFPIVFTNNKGQRIYNPNFKTYFDKLKTKDYIGLAKKVAREKTNIFRNMYLENNEGEMIDIMENGALSCASFVSNILYHYNLISSPSVTVNSTIEKLKNEKRTEVAFNEEKDNIKKIPTGTILIWANKRKWKRDDFFIADYHLGFYIGGSKAISNIITDKTKKVKSIAIHDAIRTAPKLDHYDKIEIIKYFILKNL